VGIERVLATLDPDADRRFIKDQTSKVARHSKSTDKSERLQDVRELFDCGTTLMRTATRERGDKHEAALTYRTGLQIALLARRPLRLSNFANLRIGEHIRSLPLTDGFHIMLEPDETKAHKAVTIGFPDDLVEAYEKYLVQWRPLIPPVRPKDDEKHVWLSISGGRQSKIDLYRKIVGATADYFQLEKGINPHLFRDCLATSLSLLDPGEWPIAYQILGNTPTMVERFYDHSSTLRASETGSDFLDALITKLKS
jgi:hypothetical protein